MRKSRSLGYSYSYFSQSMGDSFPSDSYPMVYFIPWKMLRSSHQYPISWGKTIKPILYKEPRKLVTIAFPKYGCFCSTRFLSYGMLHYMENTWAFPSISHRMGKSTHQREPRKLILNSSKSMGGSLPSDSHLMACFTKEIHRSSQQYPIALEKAANPILWEELGKLVPIPFQKHEWFSSIKFPSYRSQGKFYRSSYQFPKALEKTTKLMLYRKSLKNCYPNIS